MWLLFVQLCPVIYYCGKTVLSQRENPLIFVKCLDIVIKGILLVLRQMYLQHLAVDFTAQSEVWPWWLCLIISWLRNACLSPFSLIILPRSRLGKILGKWKLSPGSWWDEVNLKLPCSWILKVLAHFYKLWQKDIINVSEVLLIFLYCSLVSVPVVFQCSIFSLLEGK